MIFTDLLINSNECHAMVRVLIFDAKKVRQSSDVIFVEVLRTRCFSKESSCGRVATIKNVFDESKTIENDVTVNVRLFYQIKGP